MSLAPPRRASNRSSRVTRVSSIAASSTITTVLLSQIARPFLSRNSSACTVEAGVKPSAFKSSATLLVGARPMTRRAPLLVMRVANGGKRKTLAGARPPLDDFESALGRGVLERRPLILAKRFFRQRTTPRRFRHGFVMARVGEGTRFPKRLALLGPHVARGEALACF